MIRAGELDRTIIIERATAVIGTGRTVTQTWAPLATMRAKLVTITTADILRSGGALGDATRVFQTRWIDGLTLADRITYIGAPYTIKDIVEIGRRVALEFRCEALQ